MFKRRCPWLSEGMHASTPLKMTTSILAAAVLHQFAKFCEQRLDEVPNDYLDQEFNIPVEFIGKSGSQLRLEVTKYLKSHFSDLYIDILTRQYVTHYV